MTTIRGADGGWTRVSAQCDDNGDDEGGTDAVHASRCDNDPNDDDKGGQTRASQYDDRDKRAWLDGAGDDARQRGWRG